MSCKLEDLEVCYKGIHEIYEVDQNGDATHSKEVYGDESYFGYYYCTGCGEDWASTSYQDQQQAWKLAKEHLDV